jgi:hypothetical protein
MISQEKDSKQQSGFSELSESERLRRDVYRPDKEKFLLFVEMLERNALLKKAKIIHK